MARDRDTWIDESPVTSRVNGVTVRTMRASGNQHFASKVLACFDLFGQAPRQIWRSFLPKSALACQLLGAFLRVRALA
jgi:hypothetical protein